MLKILIIILFSFISIGLSAQPGGPPPPDEEVPITGIEILIAAGGLFGAKKIYDSSKKKK